MISNIEKVKQEISLHIIKNIEELEHFRLKYLSKKGLLNQIFEDFKNLSPEEKRGIGLKINELKEYITDYYNKNKNKLTQDTGHSIKNDLSLPGDFQNLGSRHPISSVKNEINAIFNRLGFTVSDGPEIEDDWHVFSALNFPPEHPARDMQDTFFINKEPEIVLRTHTSSVQVRVMETTPPPIRMIMPGRVYRNEAISARSHCFFHQIEGLYIDKNVSFADLKQTLLFFAKEFFGSSTKIRLRPSYFPFTEPSAEVDISCNCNGKGCNLCKYTGWLEILGCGMVDPNVLHNCHIDPKIYSGYAFGMGIERIALLKYEVKDIRVYSENDVRFLSQFSSIL
jgi:phenylalanyl-tRNA synthetase alpha chain